MKNLKALTAFLLIASSSLAATKATAANLASKKPKLPVQIECKGDEGHVLVAVTKNKTFMYDVAAGKYSLHGSVPHKLGSNKPAEGDISWGGGDVTVCTNCARGGALPSDLNSLSLSTISDQAVLVPEGEVCEPSRIAACDTKTTIPEHMQWDLVSNIEVMLERHKDGSYTFMSFYFLNPDFKPIDSKNLGSLYSKDTTINSLGRNTVCTVQSESTTSGK